MRIKRPLCAAAVIWAAAIWLLGNAGIPFFSWDSPGLLGDVKDEKVLVIKKISMRQLQIYI